MSLFSNTGYGCCVCGVTHIRHPDADLAAQLGHPEPEPEEVTWLCSLCDRLVCRLCAMRDPDFALTLHDPTRCTEPECVAATQVEAALCKGKR